MTGTSGNDRIRGNGLGDTLVGGSGDDTYIVLSQKDQIVEQANGGNDSVISYAAKYTLAANVENLTLGGYAWYGQGNAGNNILTATQDNQVLDGGGGNDVLVSQANHTTFITAAGAGSDAIYGFNSTDVIRLDNYGLTSFAQVQSIASQQGANTVLNFANGEKLVLENTKLASLGASNFGLGLDTSKLTMTFDDEFNTLSLASNGGTWSTNYGYGGPNAISSRTLASNGEKEIYMDPAYAGTGKTALGINPFSLNNGVLTITAAPTPSQDLAVLGNLPYTSGLLTTKSSFSEEYGYFEVRAKLPSGNGFWPAFWLLPTDNSWPPEIDVFEQLGADPSTVYMSTVTGTKTDKTYTHDLVNVDTTQWHTYGVDWGPQTITFYIDGNAVGKIPTPTGLQGKEMYMLLDLAVGGWGGTPGAGATAQMQVDYVRAYATANTVSMTVNGVQTAVDHTGNSGSGSGTGIATGPSTPPDAPTAANDSYTTSEGKALTIAAASGVLANDTHDAALTATAAVLTGPAHGTLALSANGSFVYTPTAGFSGTDSFTYTETDSQGATATATATIAVAKVLPTAVNDSGFATAYATPLTIAANTLTANDTIANGYALSVTGVSGASHGSVALANGVVTFTPDAFYSGAASFTYTVSDAYGDSATATVNLTVGAEQKPISTYIYGLTNGLVDKHASSYGWQITAAGNSGTIEGGHGANSLNGGTGAHVTIIGGQGNDQITAGTGLDTMTGGGGADTFSFAPGHISALTASGQADTITDFISASASANQHDILVFHGFGKAATLSYASTLADGDMVYHLSDGANSGDIILNTNGHLLTSADYLFMAN